MKDVAKRLDAIRKHFDLSINDLASTFKVSESQAKNYMTSRTKLPIDKTMLIADKYGIDATWLITGKGTMFLSDRVAELPDHYTSTQESVEELFELPIPLPNNRRAYVLVPLRDLTTKDINVICKAMEFLKLSATDTED